jgi:hypothetical protein
MNRHSIAIVFLMNFAKRTITTRNWLPKTYCSNGGDF